MKEVNYQKVGYPIFNAQCSNKIGFSFEARDSTLNLATDFHRPEIDFSKKISIKNIPFTFSVKTLEKETKINVESNISLSTFNFTFISSENPKYIVISTIPIKLSHTNLQFQGKYESDQLSSQISFFSRSSFYPFRIFPLELLFDIKYTKDLGLQLSAQHPNFRFSGSIEGREAIIRSCLQFQPIQFYAETLFKDFSYRNTTLSALYSNHGLTLTSTYGLHQSPFEFASEIKKNGCTFALKYCSTTKKGERKSNWKAGFSVPFKFTNIKQAQLCVEDLSNYTFSFDFVHCHSFKGTLNTSYNLNTKKYGFGFHATLFNP